MKASTYTTGTLVNARRIFGASSIRGVYFATQYLNVTSFRAIQSVYGAILWPFANNLLALST